MERKTDLNRAKELMSQNFIGPLELEKIKDKLGIQLPDNFKKKVPGIGFSESELVKMSDDYLLVLTIPYYKDGTALTIAKMRQHFGFDPAISEPCFYNQDWYLKEKFANECNIELKWNLIKKNVYDEYREKLLKIWKSI